MQIRNDYNSYSGAGYQQSHSHHITECLHEEKKKQQGGAAMGIQKETGEVAIEKAAREEVQIEPWGTGTRKGSGRLKVGMGFIREAWDALGEEGELKDSALPMHDTVASRGGIHAAAAAVKQKISDYIVNKWEAAKEKLKTGIQSFLKRFGKGSDAFAALTDTGSQAAGERNMGRQQTLEGQTKGTRAQREEIPAAYQSENHLMDSYSKNGEYCRLGENLTYQKKAVAKRTEKPARDRE